MSLGRSLLAFIFTLFFLFSSTPFVFAHPGHDHPEESPTISVTQGNKYPLIKIEQTSSSNEVEEQPATPLWIPALTVIGGIAVGGIGIFLLHTRVLHPKNKR